jgi:hypothetical protein
MLKFHPTYYYINIIIFNETFHSFLLKGYLTHSQLLLTSGISQTARAGNI